MGTIAKSQGDDAQALVVERQGLTLARKTNHQRNISPVLSRLGELALGQGDRVQTSARYRESLLLARKFEDKEVVGYALLGLARIARAMGQYWRAASLLESAEARLNASIDLVPAERADYEREVAATRTYLGKETYAKARDEGRSMSLEQALTASEPPIAANLHAPPAYPDGLTPREVEVLRLVALGLTDAQVADKLVISPRTVQGHLRSIYNKIYVNSRTAATRFAVDHKLI